MILRLIRLALCVLSTGLFAEGKPAGTLRFVGDIFPDLLEELDQKRICGIVPYLAKAATESIGYRYEMEKLPLPRALKAIRTRSRDGIIGIYPSEERGTYIQFTKRPLYTDTIRVFTQKNSDIKWNGSMESLISLRIGVMQGWYYTERFKKLKKDNPRYRFEWIPLRESGFKMLGANRIDVLISNDRNYQKYQETLKHVPAPSKVMQDIRLLEPPLETKGVHIGFAQHVPAELVHQFDKALEVLLKDPRFHNKLPDPKTLCPSP
jgi:polar amino acid transport system substrate-binding protein